MLADSSKALGVLGGGGWACYFYLQWQWAKVTEGQATDGWGAC